MKSKEEEMNCCLWLNRVKVWNCADIKNNFDLASLSGYFRGGNLVRWLKANGGIEEARKLEETGDIKYAFGFVGRGVPDTPKIFEPPFIIGVPRTSHPTSRSFNSGSFGGSGSGSGSGCLGYGLHII
jgi:hypothetical protein